MNPKPIKLMIIFGTRPEAIKLLPVVLATKDKSEELESVVVTTAQHREMLDQVLNIFDIKPDYDLNIMTPNQSLFSLTSKILIELEPIIDKEKPDVIVVQGDTTTTLVGSLAAFYKKVKVAHIEAGLRTHLKYAPFPEEINRKLTSCVTDFHFSPTETSRQNLLAEGYPDDNIYVTGNTGIDTLFKVLELKKINESNLKELIDNTKKLILVTAHRRESFGDGFINICNALVKIVKRNKDVQLIYPVHLNPYVQDPVSNLMTNMNRIHLIKPVEYLDFVNLMNKAHIVITDSGGVQEEAPSLGKPVMVMRDKTERPEAVIAGTAKIVGTNQEQIIAETEKLLHNTEHYKAMANAVNPYGDGKATERIVNILRTKLMNK